MQDEHAHDDPPPTAVPQPPEAGAVSRRDFLTRAAGAAGVATVGYFWFEGFTQRATAGDVEATKPGAPRKTFTAEEWVTLEAACDRLLPSAPGSPGARDVNAIGYLDAVLQDPAISEKKAVVIRDGAKKLTSRAQGMGAVSFARLPPEKQDEAIAVFETFRAKDGSHPGHAWLKTMLQFILEAFFGDPVHGGNPDGIAWAWAGHRPGFPRPKPSQKNWRPTERA